MNRGETSEFSYNSWTDNPSLEHEATPFQQWLAITWQIVSIVEDISVIMGDVKQGTLLDTRALYPYGPIDAGNSDYYGEMYTVNVTEAKAFLDDLTKAKNILNEARATLARSRSNN